MKELDKFDYAILKRLQENGRLTSAKLANELSLSEAPCWRRLKKLEKENYIKGYQANLNRRKLGFDVLAFVQISCIQHDKAITKKIEDIILNSDYVLSCHNTTGDSDFLLQVVAKDLDDYSYFMENTLRTLPGITSINSNINLREIKSSHQLPINVL